MATCHAKDISFSRNTNFSLPSHYDGYLPHALITPSTTSNYNTEFLQQKHTSDQEALSEFIKEFGKTGISNNDADTLLDWAKEYDFPHRDDRGKPHWIGGEHIHLGPKHFPVINYGNICIN